MVRQLTVQTSYICEGDKDSFVVTLRTLKNSEVGAPRYEALITRLSHLEKERQAGAWRYTFTGHYKGGRYEAEWILEYHLAHCE